MRMKKNMILWICRRHYRYSSSSNSSNNRSSSSSSSIASNIRCYCCCRRSSSCNATTLLASTTTSITPTITAKRYITNSSRSSTGTDHTTTTTSIQTNYNNNINDNHNNHPSLTTSIHNNTYTNNNNNTTAIASTSSTTIIPTYPTTATITPTTTTSTSTSLSSSSLPSSLSTLSFTIPTTCYTIASLFPHHYHHHDKKNHFHYNNNNNININNNNNIPTTTRITATSIANQSNNQKRKIPIFQPIIQQQVQHPIINDNYNASSSHSSHISNNNPSSITTITPTTSTSTLPAPPTTPTITTTLPSTITTTIRTSTPKIRNTHATTTTNKDEQQQPITSSTTNINNNNNHHHNRNDTNANIIDTKKNHDPIKHEQQQQQLQLQQQFLYTTKIIQKMNLLLLIHIKPIGSYRFPYDYQQCYKYIKKFIHLFKNNYNDNINNTINDDTNNTNESFLTTTASNDNNNNNNNKNNNTTNTQQQQQLDDNNNDHMNENIMNPSSPSTTTTTNYDIKGNDHHHNNYNHNHTELYIKCINTAIYLLERNVHEYSIYIQQQQHGTTNNNNNNNIHNETMTNTNTTTSSSSSNTTTSTSTKQFKQNPNKELNHVLWFCNMKFINDLYNIWKYIALLQLQQQPKLHPSSSISTSTSTSTRITLITPQEIIQSLERMSNLLPYHFHYNITILNMIMDIAIQQQQQYDTTTTTYNNINYNKHTINNVNTNRAPQIAEQLLDFIQNESKKRKLKQQQLQQQSNIDHDTEYIDNINNYNNNNTSMFNIEPTSYTYNLVLQAWIDTGSSYSIHINERIDHILNEYHTSTSSSSTLQSQSQQIQQQVEEDTADVYNNDNTIAITTNMNTNPSRNNNNNIQHLNHINDLEPYIIVMRYYANQTQQQQQYNNHQAMMMKKTKSIQFQKHYNDSNNNNNNNNKIESIYDLIQQHPIHSKQCNMNIPFLLQLLYCYIQIHDIDHTERTIHHILSILPNIICNRNTNKSNHIDKQQQQQQRNDILQSYINDIMLYTLRLMTHYRDQISLHNTAADTQQQQQQDYINRAEQLFHSIQSLNEYDPKTFARITCKMMDMYAITRQIDLVEQLFDQITNNVYDKSSTGSRHYEYSIEPYHTILKVYSNCNQPDRAEEFVRRRMLHPNSKVKPDIATINILINAYTESIRYNYNTSRSININNTNNNYDHNNSYNYNNNNNNNNNNSGTVTKSMKYYDDASEAAYNIYRWLKTNQRCIQLNLRPTLVTYTTMLKLFSFDATMNSNRNRNNNDNDINNNTSYKDNTNNNDNTSNNEMTIGDKIELLLYEMEYRYKTNHDDMNCKPNVKMYTMAIKTLLTINDYNRAYTILQRMEDQLHIKSSLSTSPKDSQQEQQVQLQSADDNDNNMKNLYDLISVRPNIRTYSEFLIYYNKMRTTDGAKLAEKLHNHMRKLSQTVVDNNTSLKPDVYTYNLVINAWIVSGDPNMTTYIWSLYEQMTQNDHIDMNLITYSNIIAVLSHSKRSIDIRRTIQLVQQMHDDFINLQQQEQQPHQRYDGIHTISSNDIDIGQVYCNAFKGCMKRNDQIAATIIIKLYIDSYIKGHFIRNNNDDNNNIINRSKFNWIIDTYITYNQLQSATDLLYDIVQYMNLALESNESNHNNTIENIAWIGPDLNTILDLRKAWTTNCKSSSLLEKNDALSKLDNTILPTLVRFVNIEKGNIVQKQQSSSSLSQKQQQQQLKSKLQ